MAKHDDLLNEGPRQAPEAETAEEKSKKLGLKGAGGAVAGGGIVAAKAGAIGGLGKFFIWLFAWNSVRAGWRIGGWIGLALVIAVIVVFVVLHNRKEERVQ
jgi:hypothetical protein